MYIKYMSFVNILLITFFIQVYADTFPQLNGSKYFYVSQTVQLNITHLLAHG